MRTTSGMLFFVGFVVAASAAACAHRGGGGGGGERREARRDTGGPAHGDWTRLGERWVDGVRDRDVITVGAHEGRYRRIMIVVEHSALEMFDVVVTFGDGSRFSPATRHVFSANTRSHIIDLPGDRRVIRTVEFKYGNLPGGGRAQAQLWAE